MKREVTWSEASISIRPTYTALAEKLDGVTPRIKIRLRYYNENLNFIRLEKKCKKSNLYYKEGVTLNLEKAEKLLEGDFAWMKSSSNPLLQEFYLLF